MAPVARHAAWVDRYPMDTRRGLKHNHDLHRMATAKSHLVGLIGDVHSEHERLAQTLEFLQAAGITCIVCTGDIVDGPGCPNRSIELLLEYDVKTVAGNHDRWLLQDKVRHLPMAHHKTDLTTQSLGYLQSLNKTESITCHGQRLLLCHGMGERDLEKAWPGTQTMPIERNTTLDALIKAEQHDWLINGHLHFRTIMAFKTLTVINAGTLTGHRWPGFCVLDLDQRSVQAFEFTPRGVEPAVALTVPAKPEWHDTQSFQGDWEPLVLFKREPN